MVETGAELGNWGLEALFEFFGSRVLFAVLCGAIIGLERELKHKVAGIKTNILICVGAALYTSISIQLSAANTAQGGMYGDPARIAAQIVSGVGFLGGGAIMVSRGTIMGLTTAATIWVVAAIGVCVGVGRADIAILSSILVILILVGTTFFEDRILGRSISFACEIMVEDPQGQVRMSINQTLEKNDLSLDDYDLSNHNGMSLLKLRYRGHRNDHKKFILALWATPGVREVKQV